MELRHEGKVMQFLICVYFIRKGITLLVVFVRFHNACYCKLVDEFCVKDQISSYAKFMNPKHKEITFSECKENSQFI
jgi:hypothetical protein